MKIALTFLILLPNILLGQTDYNELSNWYYHPDKTFNFIENYELDIAVINKNLEIDSIIQVENNAGINTGVDIFWVHPTHLTNPPIFPTAVPIQDQDVNYISLAILGQGALLSKYGRFYAPKYRQASPASFLGIGSTELERANGLMDTYSDIKAAFLHYLNNSNDGNKIILAGHSQGSFLLAMLLRELFDNNQELKDKLVTASLGGMGYVYTFPGDNSGGWWENISLCTSSNECSCIHFWRTYKDSFDLPHPNSNFPSFNQILVDSGLVFRTTDLSNDIFWQDSLFYGTRSSPLRYYITPDASYDLAPGYNNLAFDSLYSIKFKRESNLEVGWSLERIEDPNDQRPNDIDSMQTNPFFSEGDLHIKDYHAYIWSLMKQIDSKLAECNMTTSIQNNFLDTKDFLVYPNPSNGTIKIKMTAANLNSEEKSFIIVNMLGQIVQSFNMNSTEKFIHLNTKGIYYIVSQNNIKKLIVN